MQYKKLLMPVLIALSVTACKQQKAEDASNGQAAETTSEKNVVGDSGKTFEVASSADAMPGIPVPDKKVVLFDIYKEKVEEVSGSQLSDGRYVSYWSGQSFSYKGKKYFVAFTEATPASEIEYPAPEDKVDISQATYELLEGKWTLKATQAGVGKFGGSNKAPVVDAVQKTTVFRNAQGQLLIATPSVIFANMGIQLFFKEIFVFSPENEKWQYLGSVKAGSDNTAGCAHEADSATKTPCATSSGSLQFSLVEGSSWPELKVLLTGAELDASGKLITLSDKNAVTYRYDAKSSSYLKASQ